MYRYGRYDVPKARRDEFLRAMTGQVLGVLHEALIIRLEFTGLPFRLVRALLALPLPLPVKYVEYVRA